MSGSEAAAGQDRLAVVIPMYNEAARIEATLAALAAQRHAAFDLVVVDNGSTDGSGDLARAAIARLRPATTRTTWRVITEPEKGTGAAADTGMRAAIAAGATLLARTDADCLPPPDWTTIVVRALTPTDRGGEGLEMVAGRLVPRTDEGLDGGRRLALQLAEALARLFGRVRPSNRRPAHGDLTYRGPYVMTPGCNMAIRSTTYLAAGGFPRTRIEDVHEDRALVNAVRLVTSAYGYRREMVVAVSSRRAQAWGLRHTLRWYANHSWRGETPDVR